VVSAVNAGLVGLAVLQLGAGRARADAPVDFAVGMDRLVKGGESIAAGQVICRIHGQTEADFLMAAAMMEKAVEISRID
jgi:thymidine phosphorylase